MDWGFEDRSRIDTKMFGPAMDWGFKDRSGIDTKIPNPADIERTEPEHTLQMFNLEK